MTDNNKQIDTDELCDCEPEAETQEPRRRGTKKTAKTVVVNKVVGTPPNKPGTQTINIVMPPRATRTPRPKASLYLEVTLPAMPNNNNHRVRMPRLKLLRKDRVLEVTQHGTGSHIHYLRGTSAVTLAVADTYEEVLGKLE